MLLPAAYRQILTPFEDGEHGLQPLSRHVQVARAKLKRLVIRCILTEPEPEPNAACSPCPDRQSESA